MDIPTYFANRSVFITGASGFMGKVLVEKLLRTCPKIKMIYILSRGRDAEEIKTKLAKMRSYPLFDKIKKEQPGDLEAKVVPIQGDIEQLGLGLSQQDRERLCREVTVVYHAAATVRFDQSLKEAVIVNVRGTRETCKLALEIKEHQTDMIFLHMSTAYAHTIRDVVEEQIYPAPADWRQMIDVAESLDDIALQIISVKYMDAFPNTYTFTKSLAESAVADLCGQGGWAVVMRPSIVIAAAKEPMPGWIDNFNGPTAMMAASATGIVRIHFYKTDVIPDYIPVDVAINGIIKATWKQHQNQKWNQAPMNAPEVYNCTSFDRKAITMDQLNQIGSKIAWDIALNDCLWYPSSSHTSCKTWYYINVMLFHMVPAILMDLALNVLAIKKRSLVTVQRRIFIATMSLSYFMTNQWSFINDKMVDLDEDLEGPDKENFEFAMWSIIDPYDYVTNACLGAKKYLLKEDMSRLPQDVAKARMLYYVDRICKVTFFMGVFGFVSYYYKSVFALD